MRLLHSPCTSANPLNRTCMTLLSLVLLGARVAHASIELDLGDPESIKDAAKHAAEGMLEYYTGDEPGDVPGNLPDPYFWWEAGAMFGALIDYWHYTGDDSYNDIVQQAMLHQVGQDENYMPQNQSSSIGNDDQSFWGMAALTAAEDKFPNPPEDQPQWLALAQAVFNSQSQRWDDQTCGGGLRWQIYTFKEGYDYKNTISNGCFFNIAARLALYTGNQSYADWADTTWDWMEGVGLISDSFQAFDGTDANENCTGMNHLQWTYNSGVLLHGAATMYNFTEGSEAWKQRIEGLIEGGSIFFSEDPPDVMAEVTCESNGNCNIDQRSFKAYLSRFMAATAQLAPFSYDAIMTRLSASAMHAALQCNGPENACGLRWTEGAAYSGQTGVGEQMAAMEVFQSNLVDSVEGPANEDTGISEGDPNAGMRNRGEEAVENMDDVTMADRVGAGFATMIVLVGVLSGAWFMIS